MDKQNLPGESHREKPISDSSTSEFDSLNLNHKVLAGIRDAGFSELTPIQRLALPRALDGKDLCAQAQTGTGKTATFLISLFDRIIREGKRKDNRPVVLVLAPTRELAVQIHKESVLLGRHTDLRLEAIYGGEGFNRQDKALKRGVDVVIGTPGRLLDFVRRKVLDLRGIRYLVVDEADRLLDLGFWDELRSILRRLPPANERQSMLFSATLDSRTKRIAREFMNRPTDIAVEPERIAADGIDQAVYHVDRDMKFPLLLGILSGEEILKGLIFANMKVTAAWLVRKLRDNGYKEVGLLTGDLRQSARNKVLAGFKEGKIPLLIASDVASRGLHIDDVTHIINYDVPQDPEDYVHRIGRTARAGKRGKAYTLACDRYCLSLPDIEDLIGSSLPYRVPYDDDYGKDRTPEFTLQRMLRRERAEKKISSRRESGRRTARRVSGGGISRGRSRSRRH